jgi:signal transduction histidine kinase
VRDTGIGIPADEQADLFTPFFRTMNSRIEEIPGTGLGLSIVKDVMLRHQGAVDVISTAEGSTFTMRLPRAGPEVGSPA